MDIYLIKQKNRFTGTVYWFLTTELMSKIKKDMGKNSPNEITDIYFCNSNKTYWFNTMIDFWQNGNKLYDNLNLLKHDINSSFTRIDIKNL